MDTFDWCSQIKNAAEEKGYGWDDIIPFSLFYFAIQSDPALVYTNVFYDIKVYKLCNLAECFNDLGLLKITGGAPAGGGGGGGFEVRGPVPIGA